MADIVVETAAGIFAAAEHFGQDLEVELDADLELREYTSEQLNEWDLSFLEDKTYEELHKKTKSHVVKAICDQTRLNKDVSVFRLEDVTIGEYGAKLITRLFLKEGVQCEEINVQRCTNFNEHGVAFGYIMDLYPGKLKRLVASRNKLKGITAAKISTAIQHNVSEGANALEFLDLSENDIEDTGGYIGKLIAGNTVLQECVLHTNKLRDLCARSVAHGLQENNALVVLDLTNNKVTHHGAKFLYEGIKDSTSLERLLLGENDLGREGGTAIGKLIEENTSLLELQLQANGIGDGKRTEKGATESEIFAVGGVHAIAEGLTANSTLKKLRLGQNEIGNPGITSLAQAIATKTDPGQGLDEIWLPGNLIGDEGLKNLSEALVENQNIKTVNLNDNHIDTGVIPLAIMIANDNSIENLMLANNAIDDFGAETFAKAIIKNEKLVQLDLAGNNIGDEGAGAIARVQADFIPDFVLDLSRNPISDEVVEAKFAEDKMKELPGTVITADRYTVQANLDDFGVRIAESETETCFSRFLLLFAILVIFADFVLDALVVSDFVQIATNRTTDPCEEKNVGLTNYYVYAAIGLTFLLAPTIYLTIFFTKPKGTDTIPKRIGYAMLNILQLRIVYETWYSIFAKREDENYQQGDLENHYLKKERTTTQELGSVRLAEAVLESGPQILLQVHVVVYSTLHNLLSCSPTIILVSISVSMTVLGQTLADLFEKQLVIRQVGKLKGVELFWKLLPCWIYHSLAVLFRAATIALMTSILEWYIVPVYLIVSLILRFGVRYFFKSERSWLFVLVVMVLDNSSWDTSGAAHAGSILNFIEGALAVGLLFIVPEIAPGNGFFSDSVDDETYREYQGLIAIGMGTVLTIYVVLYVCWVSPLHDYDGRRKMKVIEVMEKEGDLRGLSELKNLKSTESTKELQQLAAKATL